MRQCSIKIPSKKFVVPQEIQVVLHENLPDMNYISGMMCFDVIGVALPPFFVLSKKMHLPTILREFRKSQQIYVASNKYIYTNRNIFLIWVHNFIHFSTDYCL